MNKKTFNKLAGAVMLAASTLAGNAAEAANPAVEAKAVPTFAQNLNASAVVPTGPALQANKGFSPIAP